MASEESICWHCEYHGFCDDERDAMNDGKLIGDCAEFQQEDE